MKGWYEFVYRNVDGSYYSPVYFHRSGNGMREIIDKLTVEYMLSEEIDNPKHKSRFEELQKFHPDSGYWYEYPTVLSEDDHIGKIDVQPKGNTLYTRYHDILQLGVSRPLFVAGQEFDAEISDDIVLKVNPNMYSLFREKLHSIDTDQLDLHFVYFSPESKAVVPTEMVELMRSYDWDKHKEYVRVAMVDRDQRINSSF